MQAALSVLASSTAGSHSSKSLCHTHLCYGQLLLGNIARDVDHFHPVPQGLWDCFSHVGSTNEENLAVVGKIKA